jgi:TonB family protein
MSLSSVAVAQREKEAKSLNAFLLFSLIGSLALHIGVLSLGVGKFLSKAPEVEKEPIEVAIIELPNPPKLELKQETEAKGGSGGGESRAILGSGGSEGFGVAGGGGASQEKSPSPRKIASSNSSEVLKAQPAPQKLPLRSSKVISTPQQNQRTNLEKVPAKIVAQPKPVVTPPQEPSEIVTQPKPVATPAPIPVASATVAKTSNPIAVDRSSQIQQQNNQRLNSLLVNAKNAREQASQVNNSGEIAAQQGKIAANLRNQAGSGVTNSNGLGNSAGNELRNGTGTGNGNSTSPNNRGTGNSTGTGNGGTGRGTGIGTGNGTGNGGTGRGNNVQSGSTVATGTRNIERRTPPAESSSSSGRLGCRTCSKPKYPESARKRRLEGKAEIKVDVDSKGNVTNVRLAQTSGHAELDKAAVEQARNWKFNTPNGAAQGVTAKVDFAIEGSKRSRQIRERRRQRTARKQPVASSQNTQTTPVVRTPARQNTNTALNRSLRRQSTTVRRRRVVTLPPRQASDAPQRQQRRQSAPSQTRLRESLRRSPRATSPNQTRRRRQPQATSPNQSKLRQSLRLHKQSQSTPSNNSNEP